VISHRPSVTSRETYQLPEAPPPVEEPPPNSEPVDPDGPDESDGVTGVDVAAWPARPRAGLIILQFPWPRAYQTIFGAPMTAGTDLPGLRITR
jgi:hypothetical protein